MESIHPTAFDNCLNLTKMDGIERFKNQKEKKLIISKDKKIIKQKWEHLKGDETFQRCFLAFKNSLEKHLPMSVFNF